MEQIEGAWVAGLFDIGGRIHISPEDKSQDRVAFTQGSPEVLEIVQEHFGGRLYRVGETGHVLILGEMQAADLLTQIQKYLRTKSSLSGAEAFYTRFIEGHPSAQSPTPKPAWSRILCESCLLEFDQLTGRGRPPKRCTGCRDIISHYQWAQHRRVSSSEKEEAVA